MIIIRGDIDTERMANRLSRKIFNERVDKIEEELQEIIRNLALQMVNNNLEIEDIENMEE
jgi:hypothetical protein|tara:strand:+ start:900 stop:1079 length:180 start_codon:yes stop_codon:yes gene_type:complete